MKHSFILISKGFDDPALCTIIESDCENLRQWKNVNRSAFFFQGIISPEDQNKWFKGYLERDNDFMFMVLYKNQEIGCMGFRLLDGQADVYNVISGRSDMREKGLMSKAIRLMCSYIYANFTRDIVLKVLKSNPAFSWYLKNGFIKVAERGTFYELKFYNNQFQFCEFQKLERGASNYA